MIFSQVYYPRGTQIPWYTFLVMEFPITVALLALFGIADPNLYRTKLWQDGADNGFNSSPNAGIYAAANYRPYKTPAVWSQFITSYNVVISVLSMFVMLAKSVMFILHVFPPLLSFLSHAALTALFAVSIYYQAGSDMSDPKHPQPGAPWYITKSCSVAAHPSNIGYCQQAKASFACTCVGLGIFALQTLHSAVSMYPFRSLQEYSGSEKRSAYAEAAALNPTPNRAHRNLFAFHSKGSMPAEKLSRNVTWGKESESTSGRGEGGSSRGLKIDAAAARSLGGLQPMTPRTMTFNRLGGTKDLPLRDHFGSGGTEPTESTAKGKSRMIPSALKSPTFGLKSPLATGFDRDIEKSSSNQGGNEMYFPPPPKVASKK